MKSRAAPRQRNADAPPGGILSAFLAHELNNIAVPLRGFIDLALDTTTDQTMRQSLDEIGIGIGRIGELAYDLESLGQQGSTPSTTSAGECLSMDPAEPAVRLAIDWSCSPSTAVNVDLGHARRAINSLARLAGAGTLTITRAALNGLACSACGKVFPTGGMFVRIRVGGLRPAICDAIRTPFAPSQKLRPVQRLTLAALVHCAHLAGGHVAAQADSVSLSIVLPT